MAQAKRGLLCSLDPMVVPGFFRLVASPAFYFHSDESMVCNKALPGISGCGSAGVAPDSSELSPVRFVLLHNAGVHAPRSRRLAAGIGVDVQRFVLRLFIVLLAEASPFRK